MHAALITTLLIAGQLEDPKPPTGKITLKRCLVTTIDHVHVAAEEPGVLMDVPAREGVRVTKGEVLARINDSEAQMRLKAADLEHRVAQKQASNDVNVKAAVAAQKVSWAEWAESREINRKAPGSIPQTQLRREELTFERAGLQVDVAKFEMEVADLESNVKAVQVEAVQAELKRRSIDAPIDGEIVQVFKRRGEWVQPGDPIVRLVRMDKLRVEGFVDAKQHLPQDVAGRVCEVQVNLTGTRTFPVNGRVSFVSPLVEASGQFRIWVEVDNQQQSGFWVLRPGLNANIIVDLDSVPIYPSRSLDNGNGPAEQDLNRLPANPNGLNPNGLNPLDSRGAQIRLPSNRRR